ncbi:negative regulator of flagellin synthesis FlgM [Luteibacter sp. Sphag1AF]|uniref:flagellar biosynthesis anti-sigma factor FlgM n=1 Tax=Luteibacter sp. Sphag1AF TaxID=2587031 RepID=UPI00161E3C16|nr:flagellar biosynthesis anti-sigma factor FlgM [Luteibacter sp. Sphag1AF]MBB3225619.1 negative regulator of flagellin synthesis FlgM [Luteibacter sp. Sphag1AF]
MNTTIKSGLQAQLLAQQQAQQARQKDTAASTASVLSTSAVSRTDDSVQLTDSAKALSAASSGDGIDTNRVEQIRARLTDGTYKPDSQAIASKLLAMEGQIGGKA